MIANTTGAIPRWRSLGPVTLFTSGPWEVVLPTLVLGAFGAVAWLGSPLLRISAVTDWRIAAVAGAALMAMIAVRGFSRLWFEPRGAAPFVFAASVIGAVAFAAASRTLFAPEMTQAAECAPLVPMAESSMGRAVSYVLPVAMWIAWMLYLLTRFPRIEKVSQLMPGRDSRYRSYARSLRVLLPVRLLLTAVIAGIVVVGVSALDVRVSPAASAEHLIAAVAQPTAALTDRARGGQLLSRLRELHAGEQKRAVALLAALDLDAARVAVRRCVCEWLLPGQALDPRITAAESAFRTLDREIDEWAFAWKPSASTGAAVIHLLPIGSAGDGKAPLYPLLWRKSSPRTLPGARITQGDVERVLYRRETVMLVRRSVIATVEGQMLVDVSVKILGRSGRDQTLPELVSKRLNAKTSDGPCPIAGSYCALWSTGRWLMRLAPEEDASPAPDTPLWLSVFDSAYFPAERARCCN
jgi:hypothetical protein